MATKKIAPNEKEPEATTNDVAEDVSEEIRDSVEPEVSAKKPKKNDDVEFCVYLGPTITGVIQSGMVLPGNKECAYKTLFEAIRAYPLIAQLIVTDKRLAEDRIKVKTAGNLLNVVYKKLASGKTI